MSVKGPAAEILGPLWLDLTQAQSQQTHSISGQTVMKLSPFFAYNGGIYANNTISNSVQISNKKEMPFFQRFVQIVN